VSAGFVMLSGQSPQAASMACGMSRATAYRLLRRYHESGWAGLRDRPPITKHCPHRLSLEAEAQIVALRRQTGWGQRSLSAALGRPASTIYRVLQRHGCSRAERLPRPAANRYEYAAVGELVHLDIKKLGRFWHVGHRGLDSGTGRSSLRQTFLIQGKRQGAWSAIDQPTSAHFVANVGQSSPLPTE
jgi:transposase